MSDNPREAVLRRRAQTKGLTRTRRRKLVRRRLHQRRIEYPQSSGPTLSTARRITAYRTKDFSLPETFCLIVNHDETLSFLSSLEAAFKSPANRTIRIDHSTVKHIGIEACLLLAANFERLVLHNPHIRAQGKLKGMCESARTLLEGVGYFSRYEGGDPEPSRRVESQTQFTQIRTGRGVDPTASGTLVESFTANGYLDGITAKRLGKCLVECLDNVSQHAYKTGRWMPLKHRWWIVGYCDKLNNELFFAMLDLGVGMPHTLYKRRREASGGVKSFLFGLNDEELIIRAFMESLSSTKKKNRGFGLPGLKGIIDRFGRGELRVFSKLSECRLAPNTSPEGRRHKIPLAGTLLTWKLLANHPNGFSS